ncbi:MAG: Ig-like domain-containing protein, partial [Candidatus Marinimicrobia bacterium]|nr:Ig-like domain-containing protein [Candidatus Neomarinimicrobiota bacterium]
MANNAGSMGLFMKNLTSSEARVMPLGIKTTEKKIQHFTNWDNGLNSLDITNKARFDDTQPGSLAYADFRASYDEMRGESTKEEVRFTDTWAPSDISIVDDLAFVSYEDYTDIEKYVFDISSAECLQPVLSGANAGNVLIHASVDNPEKIISNGQKIDLPNDAAGYHNLVLKVEFDGTFGEQEGTEDPSSPEDAGGGFTTIPGGGGESVEDPVTGISVDPTSFSMTAGDTATITATTTPSAADDPSVTFSTSDGSVATVTTGSRTGDDTPGTITAQGAGSCTITATADAVTGVSTTASVTVSAAGTDPSSSNMSLAMTGFDPGQLNLFIRGGDVSSG